MSLTFYTNPRSRGQIARWALHEAGAEYDQKLVGYGDDMKGEEYRSINPMGKVPAIVHDGKVVTECAAICAYLADVFQESGLAPNDEERADYYRWLFFAAGPVEHAVTNHANGWDPAPERARMFGYGSYDQTIDTLDTLLSGRDYVVGNRFTMADVYLGSHIAWGMQFGTMPERDSFKAYSARLMDREAFKAAKAIDEQLIKEEQAEPA